MRVELFDLFATREVVGYADLEEGGSEAVGLILVVPGTTAAGGALLAAGEPALVFQSGANADAIGDGEVRATAEGDDVIADGGAVLVEREVLIENGIARRDLGVGAPATVVTVVTCTVLKRPLFGRGVLEDGDGIVGQLGAPMGGKVHIAEDAIPDGVLRSIVGDCVGKEPARLNINPTGGTGYSLSESKRGASSQHSQDEDNSFQWMASSGRGMGSGSTSV